MSTFHFAWLTVTRHRVRSLLAVLGVAVGVAALTSVASVEAAWRQAVTKFFAPMDLETVRASITGWAWWEEAGYARPTLDSTDAEAVTRDCPAVEAATAVTWGTLRAATEEGSALDLIVYAAESDLPARFPTRSARAAGSPPKSRPRGRRCACSRKRQRQWLFGNAPAVGKYLRISGYRFHIAGVIAGRRHVGVEARAVYVPASWARVLLWREHEVEPATQLFARTRDPQEAAAQMETLLHRRLRGPASSRFTQSLWEVAPVALGARARATLYSGLAGLCALLAAGLGLAALLFVSVGERTREIGICRALGASRAHIYREHIVAAVLLAAGGAALGVAIGVPAAAAGAFVSHWQPVLDPFAAGVLGNRAVHFPRFSELIPSVSWSAAGLAAILALLTGVMAALAPASEAAGADPAQSIAQREGLRGGTRKVLTCPPGGVRSLGAGDAHGLLRRNAA